jgi:hypothetical protein
MDRNAVSYVETPVMEARGRCGTMVVMIAPGPHAVDVPDVPTKVTVARATEDWM